MGEAGNDTVHMHIGPGCLGLGLVTAAGLEANLDVHLIAREASALPRSARFKALRKSDAGEESFALPVATLCKADTLGALEPDVRRLLTDTPQLLVTIAATTQGLEDRRGFLRELAEARGGAATVFIPCENDRGDSYPEIREELEALEVECRDTMVNRLCPEVRLDEGDGCYEVVIDELAEWVIQGEPDGHVALRALGGLDYVDFVADVVPYETRKRWLVNGAHLALAILARARNLASIDVAAAEPGRARWLARLHRGLIAALEERFPGMPDNEPYAADHVSAWMRHHDEVTRILRRLKRADPLPFFDDLERKLIEPVRMLGDLSPFPEIGQVLDRLHRVLSRATSYHDYGEFESFLPTLPTAIDVRMCERYRAMLAPLLGAEEAERRAGQLGVSLESHRRRA
jgi:hypothetical protein